MSSDVAPAPLDAMLLHVWIGTKDGQLDIKAASLFLTV